MSTTEKHTAVYLGTFDPLTSGHLDIIRRAHHLFDAVIVGVGINSQKKTLFSDTERVCLIQNSCKDLPKVTVQHFSGLAIEFAKKHKAKVMLRGLRTEADYVFEMQMAMTNKALAPEIDTLFMPTAQNLCHISSSLVKEIAAMGGDISNFVPSVVTKELKLKFKIV